MTDSLYKSRINWTMEEQQFLKDLKEIFFVTSWKSIAQKINEKFCDRNRSGKQCRERYMNYLKFNLQNPKISEWTLDQDNLLFKNFMIQGTKWSIIAQSMPGRSENNLKNRFHGLLRKMIRRINKCEKEMRIKYKKPIKYDILIQILQSNNKNHCFQSQQLQNMNENVEQVSNLVSMIIRYAIQWQYQMGNEQTMELIEEIHKYNMMKKETMIEKKKLRLSNLDKDYLKQETSQCNEKSTNTGEILFEQVNNAEDGNLDFSLFSLEDFEDIENQEKVQESLFNILGSESQKKGGLPLHDQYYY